MLWLCAGVCIALAQFGRTGSFPILPETTTAPVNVQWAKSCNLIVVGGDQLTWLGLPAVKGTGRSRYGHIAVHQHRRSLLELAAPVCTFYRRDTLATFSRRTCPEVVEHRVEAVRQVGRGRYP
ncbi:hypothetical protein EDD17DRAFT_1524003 [Pisolithus thermaeus]|nr:hypothetical protein EDD17DRAFT_1524003 [Pisolithus thermaeus]